MSGSGRDASHVGSLWARAIQTVPNKLRTKHSRHRVADCWTRVARLASETQGVDGGLGSAASPFVATPSPTLTVSPWRSVSASCSHAP